MMLKPHSLETMKPGRWLSVGKCPDRLLEQWPALLKFFTSKESPSSSVTKDSSGAHPGGPDKKAQPHSDRPHERAQSSSAQQPTVTAQLKQSQVHKKPGPKQMPSISGKLVHTSIPTKQKVCSKESSAKAQEEGHCQKLKRPSSDSKKKSLSTSGKTKPRESMPLSTKQDRIKSCFERASTKLYCLFLQASIPAFDKLNLLLQSDKPNIHVLGRELQAIYTDLLCKFVKPAVLVAASSVYTVDFRSLNNQKSENDLVIGTKTRQYLHACIADKSLQHEDVTLFYSSVKAYMQKKCPLQDELLRNAQVADISQQEKVSFDCVCYFVDRFGLVKEDEMDELESKFTFAPGSKVLVITLRMKPMQRLFQLPVTAVNLVKNAQTPEEAKSPVLSPDGGQQTWYNALQSDELRLLRTPDQETPLDETAASSGQTQPLR
ncbi:UNVERIFIED_CONTAM: hypothetical protein FKN15_006764 [Acipenser sinensis]